MTDRLLLEAPGDPIAAAELAALVTQLQNTCADAVPRGTLAHLRFVVGTDEHGQWIEPFLGTASLLAHAAGRQRRSQACAILKALVGWARSRGARQVTFLCEHHRGDKPLPPAESRTGTLDDLLAKAPRQAAAIRWTLSDG